MRECIPVMREALIGLARGQAVLPLRQVTVLPGGRTFLGAMPAYVNAGNGAAFGVKVISVFPENAAAGFESHQGAVLLFEGTHGVPVAIADGGAVTAIRTAAVSAVATDALARPDAGDLALLGSGTQAAVHLEAIRCVRDLRRVRVWSPNAERAAAFAARMTARHGITVESVASVRAAVEGADIVCTVTASREPVLHGAWIEAGTHVNAVGASIRAARELDTSAVCKSRIFVDRRESALAESGDILIPQAEGALAADVLLTELGAVLTDEAAGRQGADEITLFKSLGLAVEDIAAVQHLYAVAVQRGAGVAVDFGMSHHANA